MSIFEATLAVFRSRRRKVFTKYKHGAPSPSQPVEERLGAHLSKLCDYAAMYSEAAYVAGKPPLSLRNSEATTCSF
jgi:hypothetical protein